jgi:hypothetical protein
MIVGVESNFVLELTFRQEEAAECTRILTFAEQKVIQLVIPACALFIVGQNVFWVSTFLLIFMKLMTMALCWSCAIFIAPIGLAYLYYYHSKGLTGRG